jgi:hypothetical protein
MPSGRPQNYTTLTDVTDEELPTMVHDDLANRQENRAP